MTHSYVWCDSAAAVSSSLHANKNKVQHDSFVRMESLIYTCDMTHSYVWCDSFVCVVWLNCGVTLELPCDTNKVGHDSFVLDDSVMSHVWVSHVTYMCDLTHSDTSVTWLIQMWDMTLLHMCDMTHSSYRHDSFICSTGLICTCAMTHL